MPGKSDAMWPSGPTPSSSTSKSARRRGPPVAGRGQLVRVRAPRPPPGRRRRAVGGRHRVHPRRVERHRVEQRLGGLQVSLRSGSPAGRNRSSPHQMVEPPPVDRAAGRGVAQRLAASRRAMPPPVSTSDAAPRADCASTSRVTSRAATAAASTSAVAVHEDVGRLTPGASRRSPAWRSLRRGLGVGLRRRWRRSSSRRTSGAGLDASWPSSVRRAAGRIGSRQTCSRFAGRSSSPSTPVARRQRVRVRLVGVEPAQLLGEQVAELALASAAARGPAWPVRYSGAEVAVVAVDAHSRRRARRTAPR